jgi:hypothetical protein
MLMNIIAPCSMTTPVRSVLFSVLLAGGPLALAAEPPAPQPGPGHARLGYFVGTWKTEGEFKPGAMGPGGPMSATETCEWFEGKFSIVCRSEGVFPAGPNKSIGLLSYSAEDGKYTYYGTDNTGMTMTTVSRGKVDGDTWTYEDESTMGGQMLRTRVTMKELSPTAYTFRMEAQAADGTWTPLIESTATRIGQR